ncbi:MAG TPA: ATP-binding protein, partial [Candidatus Paceibacterota bacterium]
TLAFIAVCIIVTFFSSLWLTATTFALYSYTFDSTLWSSLWVGHGVSILALGPFFLYWSNRPIFHKTSRELAEGIPVFLLITLLSFLAAWTPYTQVGPIPVLYLIVIGLVWASLRTGPRGITLAFAIVATLFSTGVLFGHAATTAPLTQVLFGMQVLLGILGIIFLPFTSITEERKDAVRNLEGHVSQLENALSKIQGEDQAKTDFIAILAHELRNPLSPILSSLELMKQTGIRQENESHIHSIATHVHIMARLLDDLLDISRISQKKFKLEVEPIEFEAIVKQTIEMVKPFMEARNHEFIVRLPQEPVWLTVDPVRLTQVFVNLLNNAAKYTDPGGKIVFTATKEGNNLVVTIKDNGIGIAPGRLPNVFEPFGGAEGVERRPGGLRIGLSLAKRMTEMHRGTIAVSSAGVGMGTQFTVTLPLPVTTPLPLDNSPARRGARRRFSRADATKFAEESGQPKMVVIDDNEPAANALAALLRGNGHEVVVGYTGADGLQIIEREKPSVALLDIGLPDMDGHELAKQVRERVGKDIILIALTGFGQSEDKLKAREAGFDEHLTKPVSIVDLERIIRELRTGS